MMTDTIAVIIDAAFEHTIKCDTDGDGITYFDDMDTFIESVESALAKIKARRAEFVPVDLKKRRIGGTN